MTTPETVEIAQAIGFAQATIDAFRKPPGVSSAQITEASLRLDSALRILSKLETEKPNDDI